MKATQCPKCKAELPRRGQFCLDCGLDLYGEGVRHRPFPWLKVLGIPAAVAIIAAAFVIGSRGKDETAPEVEAVVGQTREFLGLLAQKDYGAAVERFVKANSARYKEAEEKLWQIVRGAGAQGLKNAQSQGFRSLEAATTYVRKHRTAHPDYIGKLLYTIVSHPEPWLAPRRAHRFFEWYLEQSVGDTDVANARLAAQDARWDEGLLVVKVQYPGGPKPFPGAADLGELRWRLAIGGWGGCARTRVVLDLGGDDHLDELLGFLKRLTAE